LAQGDIPSNLMDYNGGQEIAKLQWDIMHDPGIVLGVFEKDEDQKYAILSINEIKEFANPDGTYTFIAPSGKLITIPSNTTSVKFSTGDNWNKSLYIMPLGTLMLFKTADDEYSANGDATNLSFSGYELKKTNIPYKDELSKIQDLSVAKPIVGVPCFDNGVHQYRTFKVDYSNFNFDTERKQVPYNALGKYEVFDFLIDKINIEQNNYIKFSNEIGTSKYILANLGKLSDEAEQFIYVHGDEANCSSGAAAFYVYTHAQQINKFPNLYKYCATEFNLNNPNFLIAPDVKSYDPEKFQTIVAVSSTTSVATNINSTEPYFYRTDINPPAYKKHHEEIDKLLSIKVNSEAEIITYLDQFTVYECVLKSLTITQRTDMITYLANNNGVFDGTDKYIVKVLRNTPKEQHKGIVDYFKDTPSNLKIVLGTKLGGITSSEFDEFISIITTWYYEEYNVDKNQYKDFAPPPVISATNSTNYFVINNYGIDNMYSDGYTLIKDAAMTSTYSTDQVKITNRFNTLVGQDEKSYTYTYTCKPFDLIVLEAGIGFENYSDDFKKGDRVLVPAIYAYWLIQRYNQDKSMKQITVAIEAVSLIATLGESSVAIAVLEATISTTNIIITLNENQWKDTEFYNVWSAFDQLYGLGSIAKTGFNISYPKIKEAYQNSGSNSKTFIKSLMNIADKWKSVSGKNILNASKAILEQASMLKLSDYIYSPISIAKYVGSEIKAVIISGSIYYQVATTTLTKDGDILLTIPTSSWMKPNTTFTKLDEYTDIKYINKSGVETTGTLAILKSSDNSIVLREIPPVDLSWLNGWDNSIKNDLSNQLLGDDEFKILFADKTNSASYADAWKTLYNSGSKYVIGSGTYFSKFSKLSPDVQKLLAKFTDDKSGATLSKFLDDCDNDFITYLNLPVNSDYVKSLVSYKSGVDVTPEIADEIEDGIDEITDIIVRDKMKSWYNRSVRIETNISKFKLADDFEIQNSSKIASNTDPPCNSWGGNNNKIHHKQLYVKASGSVNNVVLDDALVDPTPVDYFGPASNRQPIYKLIYHDSKLTAASPWTDNQYNDIIKQFETQPSPEFLEFEIRNNNDYFKLILNSPIKNGSKVRIYKSDIYKSISSGDGKSILQTIKVF